jgi:hypothetical protein
MNLNICLTLFVDIIFHAGIFYSVNRLFLYHFPTLPLLQKKRARFSSPSSSPSFSSFSSSSFNESHNPFPMSGSPPHDPADDPHGPADPTTNAGQYPIQFLVCFRSQAHPAYRHFLPLSRSVAHPHSRRHRCPSQARQRSSQGV